MVGVQEAGAVEDGESDPRLVRPELDVDLIAHHQIEFLPAAAQVGLFV
jgi:hypothetical protein